MLKLRLKDWSGPSCGPCSPPPPPQQTLGSIRRRRSRYLIARRARYRIEEVEKEVGLCMYEAVKVKFAFLVQKSHFHMETILSSPPFPIPAHYSLMKVLFTVGGKHRVRLNSTDINSTSDRSVCVCMWGERGTDAAESFLIYDLKQHMHGAIYGRENAWLCSLRAAAFSAGR